MLLSSQMHFLNKCGTIYEEIKRLSKSIAKSYDKKQSITNVLTLCAKFMYIYLSYVV